jgi:hypothetical protein
MGHESLLAFDLPAVGGKKVTAAFDGGRLTSNAGVLLLREVERTLGIAERLAAGLAEARDPSRIDHTLAEMLRFRMFAIAAGYEDAGTAVLHARVQAVADDPCVRHAEAGEDKRRTWCAFDDAAKSWRSERRVVARIEASTRGLDTRFIVTALAGEPEPLYERLGDLAYRPHPVVAGANPPVLIIPDVVDTELCRVLVDLWQKPVPVYRKGECEANPDAMAHATTDFKVETDTHVARLAQHHILDPAINRRLDRAFLKRVLPEIKKAYQCDIKQHEQFKILRYSAAEGGFLAAHRDNPTPETRHRLFTMTCNLGCTEFEGGELRFPEYGSQLFRVEPGAGIVWSTALLHELTPMESGERYALGTHLF